MVDRKVEQVGRFELHRTPDGDEVYFDPEPHRYYGEVKENKKSKGGYSFVRDSQMVGCSTPAKCLDTNVDPLLWWAAKLDQIGVATLAEQALDSGDSLEWLRSQPSIASALRQAGMTWHDVRDQAAQRGTNVHERIFLALASGDRPPSLAALSGAERAYGQAAIRWWRDRKPEPLYAEQVTICRALGVAGRFDLLCRIDGKSVLVDAKTREKFKVRRSDHVQLAGYEMCNVSCEIGASDYQLALILCPDGTYLEHENLAEESDFITALDAYRRGGDLEKRMREDEKLHAEPAAVAA